VEEVEFRVALKKDQFRGMLAETLLKEGDGPFPILKLGIKDGLIEWRNKLAFGFYLKLMQLPGDESPVPTLLTSSLDASGRFAVVAEKK
jgi:hypothetical protein